MNNMALEQEKQGLQSKEANSGQSLRTILYVLGSLGTCLTWGRAAADGTLLHLFYALHGSGEYILPGTQSPLRTTFTGIYWPIDYFIRMLVIFWWEAVDGSHPTTTAISIYFLMQFLGCLTPIYTDSLRGSEKKFFKTTLWLLLFQLTAVGCSGSIWALSFLATSPTMQIPTSKVAKRDTLMHRASESAVPISVLMIPVALGLGYLVPAAAMAVPFSNTFKQFAVAAWNIFPLLVLPSHMILTALANTQVKIFANGRNPISHISAIRVINSIILLSTTVSHVTFSGLSITTILFPAIFSPEFARDLHPASLAIPPLFSLATGGNTVGAGVRSFLLWDQVFGYTVVLIVMTMQLHSAMNALGRKFDLVTVVLGILGISIVGGPGSACLLLSWARDEILFA